MADLSTVKKPSISQLDDREGLALILQIRTARLTPTVRSKKRSKAASKTPGRQAELQLSKLTSQQADELYKRLEAKRANKTG